MMPSLWTLPLISILFTARRRGLEGVTLCSSFPRSPLSLQARRDLSRRLKDEKAAQAMKVEVLTLAQPCFPSRYLQAARERAEELAAVNYLWSHLLHTV